MLQWSWKRRPDHNTDSRIWAVAVGPEELGRVFGRHLDRLPGVGQGVLIVIDSKTVQGTIDLGNPHAKHLLAAYLPEEGIENRLHYQPDFSFHERRMWMAEGNTGQVMASLNNLVIALLRYVGTTNLAAAGTDAIFILNPSPSCPVA